MSVAENSGAAVSTGTLPVGSGTPSQGSIGGLSAPTAILQPARPRAFSSRFLRSELRLMFGRRRNQAGLAVLAVVPILIAVAVKLSSPRGGGGGPNFFDSITDSGLFVPLAALTVEMALLLPLALSVIAGDSIAGEANTGTLRYLLAVPVGRTRLLAVKFAAIVIFGAIATLLVAIVGVIIGVALFPGGHMTLLSGTQVGFGAGLLRVLAAACYLAIQFAAVGAIGLFLSTLTEQPIAAMIGTVVVIVAMFILDAIPQLSWLGPWLLTHRWSSFGDLLRAPIDWGPVESGIAVAACYALVFWLLAWARFSGKDVSS